jgi:hypothetical protein
LSEGGAFFSDFNHLMLVYFHVSEGVFVGVNQLKLETVNDERGANVHVLRSVGYRWFTGKNFLAW